jgi:hypothetical protein
VTDKSNDIAVQASYIDSPQNSVGKSLYAYWNSKRGSRPMPSRAEINPSEIKSLLPSVVIWSVEQSGEPFMIRLVGDNIVQFVGRSTAGKSATDNMAPDTARAMLEILATVVTTKAPRFRSGKAHWVPDKSYRDFEASFLPLSADGENVNMILGAITFENVLKA